MYDWVSEIVAIIFILLLIAFSLYHYSALPEKVPIHFNSSGVPNRFGGKGFVWTLPVIVVLLYVLLTIFTRLPHLGNYPVEITIENAKRQYRIATRLLRTMKMLIAATFFYIGFGKINIALGLQDGLSIFFHPIFLISVFGSLGIYLYQVYKK